MPERPTRSTSETVKRAAVGIGLAATAVTGACSTPGEKDNSHEVNIDNVQTTINDEIKSGDPVKVLGYGTAVVTMEDGTRHNIMNPIVEHGAVAERTLGADYGEVSLVTAYAPGQHGAKSINIYYQGSDAQKSLNPDGYSTYEEAAALTQPVHLQRVDGQVSGDGDPHSDKGANYFVPLDGALSAGGGQPIAQAKVYEAK